MKKEHELFVLAMIEHDDPVKAYQYAYPGTAEESARTAANRLRRNYPEITHRIEAAKKRVYERKLGDAELKAQERIRNEDEERERKRAFLQKLMYGELKTAKHLRYKDHSETVLDDISPFAMLRAMELDCKLAAGYDWAGRKDPKALRELEVMRKKLEQQDGFDETLVLVGGEPFDGWGSFFRWEVWLNEKPERQTPDVMAYRAKYTLPDTVEHYFREHPEEVLPEQKRPFGWEESIKKARQHQDDRHCGPDPHTLNSAQNGIYISTPAADAATKDGWSMPAMTKKNEQASKPEHSGTLPLPPPEQQTITDKEKQQAEARLAVKTGKLPPDIDYWELYNALDPHYLERFKGIEHLKEQWFRRLPRRNQWLMIQPRWDTLHGSFLRHRKDGNGIAF